MSPYSIPAAAAPHAAAAAGTRLDWKIDMLVCVCVCVAAQHIIKQALDVKKVCYKPRVLYEI